MSPQSIVCTTCDATVPYGRLSCPACGELLASVAGAARPATTRVATVRATERAAPAVLVDVPPLHGSVALSETAEAAHQDAGAPGWAAADWETPEPDEDEALEAPIGRSAAPVEWPADQAMPDVTPVEWPADQAMADSPPEASRPAVPFRSVPDAPGAYVPPIIPAEPAGPPAPARAWAGQPAVDPATAKAAGPRSSIAGDLLDATRITEFVGWLAVAGSAMAAVGFLLPWGVSVIGASGVGYFDRWGLAGPFHLVVFVSLLALLGLSLARNPIPLWLRVGMLGLGLGALLLGLTWPYLVGLSGTGPGAIVVAIGALVLTAAGVGALASDRHAHEDGAV